MHNCTYNKMKLLRDMSLMHAFITKHCKKDAKGGHKVCHKEMTDLQKSLEKHMKKLQVVLAKG